MYPHACSKLLTVVSLSFRHLRNLRVLGTVCLCVLALRSYNTNPRLSTEPTRPLDPHTKYSTLPCTRYFAGARWPSSKSNVKNSVLFCCLLVNYQAIVDDDIVCVTSLTVDRYNTPDFVTQLDLVADPVTFGNYYSRKISAKRQRKFYLRIDETDV